MVDLSEALPDLPRAGIPPGTPAQLEQLARLYSGVESTVPREIGTNLARLPYRPSRLAMRIAVYLCIASYVSLIWVHYA